MVKYRRLYGCAAALLGVMMLGTAGSADLGHIQGSALAVQLTSQLIGITACARCAKG